MTDERKKLLKTILAGSGKEEGIILWLLLGSRRGADTVKQRSEGLHKVLFVSGICLFLFGLTRLLLVYNSLPAELGVHFRGEAFVTEGMSVSERLRAALHGYQPYDVTGKKIMLFYPFAVSAAALAASVFIPKAVNRLGRRKSEAGARIKSALQTALDISALVVTAYFGMIWNEYTIRQLPMRMLFTWLYAFLVGLTAADLIIYAVNIRKRYKNREEKQ